MVRLYCCAFFITICRLVLIPAKYEQEGVIFCKMRLLHVDFYHRIFHELILFCMYLNPRRAGAPKRPWSAGGWGRLDAPPHLTRPLGVVARTRKSIRKLVKNNFETTSVNFSLRLILMSPEVIKGQMTQRVFR